MVIWFWLFCWIQILFFHHSWEFFLVLKKLNFWKKSHSVFFLGSSDWPKSWFFMIFTSPCFFWGHLMPRKIFFGWWVSKVFFLPDCLKWKFSGFYLRLYVVRSGCVQGTFRVRSWCAAHLRGTFSVRSVYVPGTLAGCTQDVLFSGFVFKTHINTPKNIGSCLKKVICLGIWSRIKKGCDELYVGDKLLATRHGLAKCWCEWLWQ